MNSTRLALARASLVAAAAQQRLASAEETMQQADALLYRAGLCIERRDQRRKADMRR
jgi:hypothetical protein